jgi:uncharacterized protein YwgA
MLDFKQRKKMILELVNKCGKIEGRTKFQKIVYILQNLGVPFEEKFTYHYFGPYSAELQLEINDLVDSGVLKEYSQNPYIYKVDSSNQIETDYVGVDSDLLQDLLKQDYRILELVATLFYLANNFKDDEKYLKSKLNNLKPHLASYFQQAFDLYLELKSMK